jgi:sigma-B regulation protein RsbU (phosphoserine phosphatase)
MPQMDGFELMAKLREVRPGLDVIFMTGAIYELDTQFIRAVREKAFYFVQKPFDREVLLTLVDRCLELRRLAAQNRRYVERLESELAEARSFQRGLLPKAEATLSGIHVAGRCDACTELGGDLYDHARVDAHRMAFLIADVSGHGVSAALLTGIVKSAFDDARTADYDPQAVVSRIARGIRNFADDKFITLLCGRVDSRTRTLEYVNAGHPPGILCSEDTARDTLTLTGPMVSPAFPDLTWEKTRIDLAPTDRVVVYTDGLTEARDAEGGLFGEERLLSLLASSPASGADLVQAIFTATAAFRAGRPSDDDETLITLSLG